MTECYECAKLAELVAENSQLRVRVDELTANDGDVLQSVTHAPERATNQGEMLHDTREDDVIAVLKAESAELEAERDQWREAAGNAHEMWEKADNERNELKSKVDELTAEIDALEYVGVLGEQIGRCKACKFAGIHDGKRWPGNEFKGRMYCIAWSDGYMAEWTKPDGFCHMWKPKEGDE